MVAVAASAPSLLPSQIWPEGVAGGRRWPAALPSLALVRYGAGWPMAEQTAAAVVAEDLVGLGGGGGGIHGGGGRCPAGERIRVGGGDGVRVVLSVSAAVVEVATNSSSCSALRRPSPRFAVPVLAVPSVVPSPSVALVLVVALAGVGVCTVLDGAAVVASRAPVAISALAGAAPGADSSSVGGSGRLVINILLQANAFGILVTGCLICSESCGSTLQVTLFLAISALIARQKSIGSLLKAPLLMVG
uniref:Uncharacterized protein n=1 Tax=Oryza nivara TaxID=4536 RepID=A0A0E0IAQ4_ORYNI